MVVVFLAKTTEGQKWSHSTAAAKAQAAKKADSAPKMDEGQDPSKSIMDMMKKMYDEGDDEMKRTIAKAWTENRDKSNPGMNLPDL